MFRKRRLLLVFLMVSILMLSTGALSESGNHNLIVVTKPDKAKVYIDGKMIGWSPCSWDADNSITKELSIELFIAGHSRDTITYIPTQATSKVLVGFLKSQKDTSQLYLCEIRNDTLDLGKDSIPLLKYPEIVKNEFEQRCVSVPHDMRVIISSLIDYNGSVLQTILCRSCGYPTIDTLVCDGMKNWLFTPAIDKDGKVARSWITMPVLFKKNDH